MRFSIPILIFLCLVSSSFAQEKQANSELSTTPIPIEALFTTEAVNLRMTVNKKIVAQSRWGFFSAVDLLNTYDNNKDKNETMVLATVSYELLKGVSIHGGMWTNNIIGTRPTIGLSYTLLGKDFVLVNMPRVDLIENHNIENVLIFEYFPSLTENLRFYGRVQGLYNYDLNHKAHDRSYIDLRIGVTYKKVKMGIGANLDFYGPKAIYKQNIGVFVRTTLF
ncbi:hypothetical protein QNH98_00450 [Myroides sp. mNGS23_01]|nr:hypothetical protein [Myroides sp. mNGS23_01]WHT39229.1 hypothetical protein QNH98_00450 [Myroides sp. mNGS23_01]